MRERERERERERDRQRQRDRDRDRETESKCDAYNFLNEFYCAQHGTLMKNIICVLVPVFEFQCFNLCIICDVNFTDHQVKSRTSKD